MLFKRFLNSSVASRIGARFPGSRLTPGPASKRDELSFLRSVLTVGKLGLKNNKILACWSTPTATFPFFNSIQIHTISPQIIRSYRIEFCIIYRKVSFRAADCQFAIFITKNTVAQTQQSIMLAFSYFA